MLKKLHKKYDIALIGLGVMGQSLARNMASRKFRVLGWDRHEEKSIEFIKEYGNFYLDYCKDFRCLATELKAPRKYLIMVPAGPSVDDVIKRLKPYLKKGDILIDGGNSNFKETIRRVDELKKKGIYFVGMGVSGGEEGALRGPSIMPGCDTKTWKIISPILKKIAAKDFKGGPCVTHVGTDGAGHYVKMVHNGIEYGIMQMMAEAYDSLRQIYGLPANKISKIFSGYNKGKLRSFLFEIAVPVLGKKDDTKKGYLVDYILDKAGQKGTGRWTGMDALELGMPMPATIEALHGRSISSFKDQRVTLSRSYKKPISKKSIPLNRFEKQLGDALFAGMIVAYAQGFELIREAAKERGWKVNLAEIARIWQGGCIIRANLLKVIHKAFQKKQNHLFESSDVRKLLLKNLPSWRKMTAYGIENGVPMPAMAATLGYFEAMTQKTVPANFIQGLRDFFGAHTYERIDRKGSFHTPWSNLNL